ncbi:MAG: hypothetical protein A2W80_04995 [Candidatus Riflebacteria bacterium GWC2_50_8]|nr:MAG: hypothetical protein A2W80_04995 [Candidatus Riflebacteria bacterium GWC2_50_8]
MTDKYMVANQHETAIGLSESTAPRVLLQILGIVIFGAIAAMGKKATMDLGISGHSALLWLSVMIAGRALIQRNGAGFALGVSTALWGMQTGMNNSLLHNIGLYGTTGLVLDLVAHRSSLDLRHPLGAIVGGALAHMVKFLFIIGKASVSVTAKRFVLMGVLQSATLHLIFGIGAGLIGFGIWSLFKPRFNRSDLSSS